MKNLILAGLTALAGLSMNTQKNNSKHKKCECSDCFLKSDKSIRFDKRRKKAKNTKSQENRKEEL